MSNQERQAMLADLAAFVHDVAPADQGRAAWKLASIVAKYAPADDVTKFLSLCWGYRR